MKMNGLRKSKNFLYNRRSDGVYLFLKTISPFNHLKKPDSNIKLFQTNSLLFRS